MKKARNEYILETSDYKILETVSLLNKNDLYPLSEGVYKILAGVDDDETKLYKNIATYKTLISYNSKKVARLIMMLLRYHYLERVYDPESDKLYLKVAPKGEIELVKYRKKHKYKFATKEVNNEPTIVKLNLNNLKQ